MSRIPSAKQVKIVYGYTIEGHEQEKEQRIQELAEVKLVGLDDNFASNRRRR